MSGIAGWVDYQKDLRREQETIARMSAAIRHRGEAYAETACTPSCALISRLRRLDSNGEGKQPVKKTVGGETYRIVFDGTIYNNQELRAKLIGKGCPLFGKSDAELVLSAYMEYGPDCLNELDGVFAFAIFSSREKSLFLARDRMGVKPLYYYPNSDGIVFASEIKSIFANPLCRPEIDNEGLKTIFLLGPGKPHGSGIYRGIYELCHAEYLVLNKKSLKKQKYWFLKAKENRETTLEAADHVRHLLTDTIRRQLYSDPDPACFLSGGLDSSIISYVAAVNFSARNKILHTLSIDYEDNEKYFLSSEFQASRDEEFIGEMSRFIGSTHENSILTTNEICGCLTAAALARDLPGMADIDSSMLTVCRRVKKRFDTVFSGECADELFGGYPWYHKPDLLNADSFPWSQSLDMRLRLLKPGVLNGDPSAFVKDCLHDTVSRVDFADGDSPQDKKIRRMFLLNFEWFMQNLLDRTDRMSMQCGLEIRVPFCDPNIAEYAYNLPWEVKSDGGREKGLLRRAFRGILPDRIVDRKKSPFPKSFDPELVSFYRNGVQKIIDDKTSILHELIDADYLKMLLFADPYANDPWYGQLMRLPQAFGYLMQIDMIFKAYSVKII